MHACLYICTFVDMETGFQQLHILYTVLLTWKQVFSCYTYSFVDMETGFQLLHKYTFVDMETGFFMELFSAGLWC